MGIFGKTNKQAGGGTPKKAPPAAAGSPPPKPAPAPKPKISAEEQSRIKEFPQVKSELGKVKAQLEHQTRELAEHEDYLRQTMEGYTESERQRQLQTKELAEHEDYLRQTMEGYSESERQRQLQTVELAEHEDYLRKTMEGFAESERQRNMQTQELSEHENYLRKVMEGYGELQRQYALQTKELKEHEEYLRNVLEGYSKLSKREKFQENELREHEEYLRQILESHSELRRQKDFQDRELREHEDYLRQVMDQLNRSDKDRKSANQQLQSQQQELTSAQRLSAELRQVVGEKEQELEKQKDVIDRSLPLLELDPEGVILRTNRAMENLLGFAPGELNGRHERITVHFGEGDRLRYDNLWNRVVEGLPQNGPFTLYTRDGKPVHVETDYTPVTDAQGQLLKVVKLVRETGHQVELEETLRAMSLGADEMMATLNFNLKGNIISANRRMGLLLNGRPEAFVNQRFQDLIVRDERQSHDFLAMWDFLRAGEPVIRPFTFHLVGQLPVRLFCTLQPVCNPRREVVRVLLVAREEQGSSAEPMDLLPALLRYVRDLRAGRANAFEGDRYDHPNLPLLLNELEEALAPVSDRRIDSAPANGYRMPTSSQRRTLHYLQPGPYPVA